WRTAGAAAAVFSALSREAGSRGGVWWLTQPRPRQRTVHKRVARRMARSPFLTFWTDAGAEIVYNPLSRRGGREREGGKDVLRPGRAPVPAAPWGLRPASAARPACS